MLERIFYRIAFPCDSMIPPDRSCSVHDVKEIYGSVIDLPDSSTYAVLLTANSPRVILYSHGNNTTLTRLHGFLSYMRDKLQVNVCAYEFPSWPCEESVNIAAAETYAYLVNCYGSENIILVGKSIGTGPTAWLSRRYSSQMTILVSPYASIKLLMEFYFPGLSTVVPDCWDSLSEMKQTVSKILFIHGEEDEVIPHYHTLLLYDRCASPEKMFIIMPGEGHNLRRREVDVLAEFI